MIDAFGEELHVGDRVMTFRMVGSYSSKKREIYEGEVIKVFPTTVRVLCTKEPISTSRNRPIVGEDYLVSQQTQVAKIR